MCKRLCISMFEHLCVCVCVTAVCFEWHPLWGYACNIEFVCLLVRHCGHHVQFQHYDLYLHTTLFIAVCFLLQHKRTMNEYLYFL